MAAYWLMVSANCKTCNQLCKKNDAELPQLRPPLPQHYYKSQINTNSGLIRIQHELTTKKSKRNCDTKQQTEALSQPLSFLSKNMVVKTVCVTKQK